MNGFIANEKGDGYKRSGFKPERYTVSIGDMIDGAYAMTLKSGTSTHFL